MKTENTLVIREATKGDLSTVLDIERRAFGEEDEAQLVANLLDDPSASPSLSLLASVDGQDVGHILFTAVSVSGCEEKVSASILAPLAVLPDSQGRGVGGALIKEGLRLLKASGVGLIFVLGHPGYYPRSGFQPAGRLGLDAPYPIPEKDAGAWMVQELQPGLMEAMEGKVQCADCLARPEYWRE